MAKSKNKKKLKKGPKIILCLLIVVIVCIGGYFGYQKFLKKEEVSEAKVVSKIPKYGYVLKDSKSKAYKKLFQELKNVLSEDKVDEKKYAKVITKMFIVDFYSLGDHKAKTDIGGVDFVHPDILENFALNAEDTIYKYVESNIYGQRKQKLPIVDKISVGHVEKTEYAYGEDKTDDKAYKVKANWTYKDENIAKGYQDEAIFIYVHDGKKLVLVEISDGKEKDDDSEE